MKTEAQELQEKRFKALDEAKLQSDKKFALEKELILKTPFDFAVMEPDWVSYRSKGEGSIYQNGVNSPADVMSIITAFPPGAKKALLRFAGKDEFETPGAFLISVTNFEHDRKPSAKITYEAENGLKIWIDVNANILKFNTNYKNIDKNSRAKNPEKFAEYTLSNPGNLKHQVYASASNANHFTYFGENADILALLQ